MIGRILTLLIIMFLACLAWAAVAHLYKNKNKCSGGCLHCSMHDSCTKVNKTSGNEPTGKA